MAQVSSGSDLSKVESDIAQTVNLPGAIVTLIREPVALLYKDITKANALKRSLGSWESEALDANGLCRVPSLRLEDFEKYLVDIDGNVAGPPAVAAAIVPESTSGFIRAAYFGLKALQRLSLDFVGPTPDGTACWAYFLAALGIQPGMGIVGWRPPDDGFISTQNGGIEMEIDGSVLCHVINLYSLQLDPSPWTRSWTVQLPDRQKVKQCDFPFGKLAWDVVGGQVHAHFTPGAESDLRAAKSPLSTFEQPKDPETVLASYLTGLLHTISKSELQLANPNAPIQERVSQLLAGLASLSDYRGAELLFVSSDWLAEAASVKKRVLANGGQDRGFFDDICATVDAEPLLDTEASKAAMTRRVRELFLFGNEIYTISVPGMRRKHRPTESVTPLSLSRATLASYQSEPAGSWKRSLFEMHDDVLELLEDANSLIIKSPNLQLLEFTNKCDLWNQKVLLGAPC